jgi:hypothetical protein
MPMSQPEMERQLTQHRSDIDALYELLDEFKQQAIARLDGIDGRLDGIDGRLDGMGGQLTSLETSVAEILRRLPG